MDNHVICPYCGEKQTLTHKCKSLDFQDEIPYEVKRLLLPEVDTSQPPQVEPANDTSVQQEPEDPRDVQIFILQQEVKHMYEVNKRLRSQLQKKSKKGRKKK